MEVVESCYSWRCEIVFLSPLEPRGVESTAQISRRFLCFDKKGGTIYAADTLRDLSILKSQSEKFQYQIKSLPSFLSKISENQKTCFFGKHIFNL
ncbi:hypothetical protein Bca4012_000775 [Brassica carinata]